MEFFVLAPDGNEYGPADVPTLQQWVAENRLNRQSRLRHRVTGQVVEAGTIADLFPKVSGAPPVMPTPTAPSNYPRAYVPKQQPQYGLGNSSFTWALIDSGLSIVFPFLSFRLGILWAAFGLVNAIQAKRLGHPHGLVAIIIASIAVALNLAILAIGFATR